MSEERFKLDSLFCQIVAGPCLGKSSILDIGLKIKKYHRDGILKGVSIIPSDATDLETLFQNWRFEDKKVDNLEILLDGKDYLYVFLDIDDFPGNISDFINMSFLRVYTEILINNSVLRSLEMHKLRIVALTHVANTDLEADTTYAFISNQWLLRQKRFLFKNGRTIDALDSIIDWQDQLYGMKKGTKIDLGERFILDYFLKPRDFYVETVV